MSSSPPPPPPYSTAAPPPSGGAWDRRALKQQRRTAKLQLRYQLNLQRAQLRAARRTSVLGPALLLSSGIVFLLVEAGTVQAAALTAWLASWWPLLLIGAGFILLLEWATDTWISTQRGIPAVPRRVGAGTSLLLVLLILIGISLLTARNRPNWIAQTWNPDIADSLGLEQILAHHSETQRDLSAPLAPKGLLTIRNYRGNITVSGESQDGLVHVSARQRLAAWQDSELRRKQESERPSLQQQGTGLLLDVPGEDRDTTDLTLEVPHETEVVIKPEKGDLTVTELRGPLTVNGHSGNVTLTALTGAVRLAMDDDNASIAGHSLSGDLRVEGRSGDLALSDVAGAVTLQGDFFGTTHLEHIQGPVHFQSSFTDLACLGVPGHLNIDGRSDLDATDLSGPVILRTTDRNLTLAEIHNGATLDDRDGSVTLSLADPLGPVKVTTTDGAVDIQLPERAGFSLAAETSDGEITNDLGLTSLKQGNRTILNGTILKGGPEVSVATNDGDVRIHRGGATPQENAQSKQTGEDD